jgi:glycosyl transferase family 25
MQVYLINLDRAKERLALFRRQSVALGFGFERIEAVDASSIREARGTLRAAEIACFESHRAAWKRLVDSGDRWGAVFEDDVHLSPDIAPFLLDDQWIPAAASIVKLETYHHHIIVSRKKIPVAGGRKLRELCVGFVGAAGYILSREAAERLLAETVYYEFAVDWVLFDPSGARGFGIVTYQLMPAVCIQDTVLASVEKRPVVYATQIQNVMHPPEPPYRGSRLARELLRFANQVIEMGRRLIDRDHPSRPIKVKFR